MKDQGKALQAIVCLYTLPRTSSSLSFRVCTRLPTSQAMCTTKGLVVSNNLLCLSNDPTNFKKMEKNN